MYNIYVCTFLMVSFFLKPNWVTGWLFKSKSWINSKVSLRLAFNSGLSSELTFAEIQDLDCLCPTNSQKEMSLSHGPTTCLFPRYSLQDSHLTRRNDILFFATKVPTNLCDREIFQSRRKSTIETFLVMIVDLCRDLKMMRSHTLVGPFVTTLIFGDKSLRSWLDRRLHFFKNDSFLRFFKNDEIADFCRDFCHDAKMKSTI